MASVAFIGGGRVARILIGGWQRAGALPQALLVCEPNDAAFRALEPHAPAARRVAADEAAIFAGGTGNPYFTTDTTASLRAMEIGAEVILKATKVDGVYDSDPLINKQAKKFDELSYLDVLKKRLKVMDATAISLCMDHRIPIIVFSSKKKGNIKRVVLGEKVGTKVRG